MIIVFLIISLLMLYFGVFIRNRGSDTDNKFLHFLYINSFDDMFCAIGGILSSIMLIIVIVLTIFNSNNSVIDDKINMYLEENEKIETSVNEVVSNYMKFESDTYADFKIDNMMAAVSLYPELKSDELVKSQIDIYIENNNIIKTLKEQKLTAGVVKWWLYFGK